MAGHILLSLCKAVVALGAAAAGSAAASAASVEIAADPRGHFVTMAEIEHASLKVIVDTGASFVALSYEDAEEAGLRPRNLTFDVTISTANGQVEAARVMLARVEIGNLLVRDVEAIVLPKGAFDGTLLGMSFLNKLSRFAVEHGRLQLRD
ncbi:MAG TPA: TIGR02281 family clan AA aspartic protease [Aestuariivirgaceae bacterium]|jgi:aspartyl protease family protein